MEEKVIVSASSLAQAQEKAAQKLNQPLSAIDYKILDEKKSFFGKTKQIRLQAWIRVGSLTNAKLEAVKNIQVFDEAENKPDISDFQTDQSTRGQTGVAVEKTPTPDGQAEILEGKLIIHDPAEGGQPAVLVPGDHVEIYVDQKIITEPTPVVSNQQVDIKTQEKPAAIEVVIEKSEDRMTAYGVVKVDPGFRYKLKDKPPAVRLLIETVATAQPAPDISIDTIQAALEKEKIKHGLLDTGLKDLMLEEPGKKALLAQGTPGRPTIHEKIEYLFQKQQASNLHANKIDYREQNQITSVKKGDPLVQIHPGQPGEDTVDIFGRRKAAGRIKKIAFKAGKGVSVSEDGRFFTADEDGQPVLRGNQIQVVPVYETKNVDLVSGNIHFNGSVIVRQNVEDNMLVEAEKDVHVAGHVSMARILAGGNIEIAQNVIGSTLTAGGAAASQQALLQRLSPAEAMLLQLKHNFDAAAQTSASRQGGQPVHEGHLILLLIEKLYPQLGNVASECADYAASQFNNQEQIVNITTRLKQCLTGAGPAQMNAASLSELVSDLSSLTTELKAATAEKYHVSVRYAQNTVIETSGDIIISGKGAYQSKLTSGGDISGTGQPGIFRGGEMYAENSITFNEIGSPAGIETTITLGSKGHVKANIAHPNVCIKSGPYYKRLKDTLRHFDAQVSNSGITVIGS